VSNNTREKLMAGLAKRDRSMLADPHLERIGDTVRKNAGVVSREKIFEIPVDQIADNPFQYRDEESLNSSELESLAVSIREHGLRSPIQVRRTGESYTLIAGWRRLTAIRRFLPDMKTVKATVDAEIDDRTHRLLTVIENEQREDFTAFEKARAYADMQKLDSLTLDEIAVAVGSSKTRISRILKLLTLPETIQGILREAVLKGLSGGHLDEIAAGCKKREGAGETVLDIENWAHTVIAAIQSGEMTIDSLRTINKSPIQQRIPEIKKPLKRWKIDGGKWNRFEVSTRNKVTLEFKLPEDIEYNDSDKIMAYIREELLKREQN